MSVPADFTHLVKLLNEMNLYKTLEEQLQAVERALVSYELNPDPVPFYDARHALAVLKTISFADRDWQETDEALAGFFSARTV
jgi:hypothetical protein